VAADIEADRGVEGRVLVDENEGKLILELVVVGGLEVPVLNAGFGDRVHDAVDELTDAVLAPTAPSFPSKYLLATILAAVYDQLAGTALSICLT
jgi:hypothetical protein